MPGIKKVFVANRGEIAARIINSCASMGIKTAISYISQESKESFVRMADEYIEVTNSSLNGLPHPYLDIKLMIEIAQKCGADAIHPGYGFLSENHLFSKACEENNIIFIGPKPGPMKLLSSKIKTKDVCKKLGIPVAGYLKGKNINSNEIKKLLHGHIKQALIKAAAGGGGRGIRLVDKHSNLTKLLKEAKDEAKRHFNDPTLLVEQYIPDARHIEIQVFGDLYGNHIHIFERECSIQRRNQKLIEEAPADSITQQTKDKLYDYAVKLIKEVNYTSLGTVEFLVDEKGNCYLQEVNTRLQVEHPVTEMITGLDIVAEQIQVAMGDNIKTRLRNLSTSGNAIECRIVAENPYERFTPSTGTIQNLSVPSLPFTRIDTYIQNNTKISTLFDSLIAKALSWGRNRKEAINRMKIFLSQMTITGIDTSIGLYDQILNEKDFIKNNISTTYLKKKQFSLQDTHMITSIALSSLITNKKQKQRFISSQNLPEMSKWRQAYLDA